jgi:hypothetical protein
LGLLTWLQYRTRVAAAQLATASGEDLQLEAHVLIYRPVEKLAGN